jgi:hypothetical protein
LIHHAPCSVTRTITLRNFWAALSVIRPGGVTDATLAQRRSARKRLTRSLALRGNVRAARWHKSRGLPIPSDYHRTHCATFRHRTRPLRALNMKVSSSERDSRTVMDSTHDSLAPPPRGRETLSTSDDLRAAVRAAPTEEPPIDHHRFDVHKGLEPKTHRYAERSVGMKPRPVGAQSCVAMTT